jgi:hypothetical protein
LPLIPVSGFLLTNAVHGIEFNWETRENPDSRADAPVWQSLNRTVNKLRKLAKIDIG